MDFDEFERWYAMAEYTIELATYYLKNKFYSWACFKDHQAGEFAIKALLRGLGKPIYGHSIYKFLEHLRSIDINVPGDLISKAKTLDQYYTPTGYPNVWVEEAPYEFYSREDAERAIKFTSIIIEWVRKQWEILSKKD